LMAASARMQASSSSGAAAIKRAFAITSKVESSPSLHRLQAVAIASLSVCMVTTSRAF
jgi:hypothetical protein